MLKFLKLTDEWFDKHPLISSAIEFACLAMFFVAGYLALIIWS